MGMYDNVNFKCRCPNCGGEVTGFQSKDGDCVLDMIEPISVSNFYSKCYDCDYWLEFAEKPREVKIFELISDKSISYTFRSDDINRIEIDRSK